MSDPIPPKKLPPIPGFPGGARPPVPPQGKSSGNLPPVGGGTHSPFTSARSGGESTDELKRVQSEKNFLEDSKRKLEVSLAEMQKRLEEEKEKSLYQAMKAREEETLSLRMEQALKEMQEKTRLARREQELDELRMKAEDRAKDLERRLNEERETWVHSMKKQMEMRDSETRQVESQMELRLKEIERRWVEERHTLTNAIKSKEAELERLRAQNQESKSALESSRVENIKAMQNFEQQLHREFEARLSNLENERQALLEELDKEDRKYLAAKSQISTLENQLLEAQSNAQAELAQRQQHWKNDFIVLRDAFDKLYQEQQKTSSALAASQSENQQLREAEQEFTKKFFMMKQTLKSLEDDSLKAQEHYENLVKEAEEKARLEIAKLTEHWHAQKKDWEIQQANQKNTWQEELRHKEAVWEQKWQNLANEKDFINRELLEGKNEISYLENELKHTREKLSESTSSMDLLRQEREHLKQELESMRLSLRYESEQLKKDYETLEKRFYEEQERWVSKFEENITQQKLLQEKLLERDQMLDQAKSEQNRWERALKDGLESEKDVLRRELEEQIHIKNLKILELESRLENYVLELDQRVEKEKKRWIAPFWEDLAKKDAEIRSLQSEILNLEKNVRAAVSQEKEVLEKQLKEKLDVRESEILALRDRLLSISNQVSEKHEQEKEVLKNSFNEILIEKQKELADLLEENKSLRSATQKETDSLFEEISQLKSEIAAHIQELDHHYALKEKEWSAHNQKVQETFYEKEAGLQKKILELQSAQDQVTQAYHSLDATLKWERKQWHEEFEKLRKGQSAPKEQAASPQVSTSPKIANPSLAGVPQPPQKQEKKISNKSITLTTFGELEPEESVVKRMWDSLKKPVFEIPIPKKEPKK